MNPANQVNLVRSKPTSRPVGRVRFRGRDAFWEIVRKLEGEPHRAETFAVLALTGLRINEARQLVWDDWNQEQGTLTVRRIAHESTKRHARVLPVGERLRAFLETLKAINDKGPYIVGIEAGTRRILFQANYWFKRLGFVPHDCRRWFRTSLEGLELNGLGVPDTLIDDLLGHRGSKVRRAYSDGRLTPDESGKVPEEGLELARNVIRALDEWLGPRPSV